jgi:type I restriction enzyme S subunit
MRNVTIKAPATPAPFVALEHIQSGLGTTVPGFEWEDAQGDSNVSFSRDDILFGKLRPYLSKVLWADRPGCCSSELLVLRPSRVFPRYAYWLLLSKPIVERAVASSTGVKMPRTRWDRLGRERIDFPEPDRQRAIAAYLDREISRIDTLLEKRQRMLALIEARTWACLLGLVEQSGATPTQLRRAFTFLTDGPFGSAFTSADYSEEGAAVVRLGNIGFGEYREADQVFVPLTLYGSLLRHRVQAGDLLIAGLGDAANHAGRACVAPNLGPAMVKGKCYCARIDSQVANAHYLAYVLSSPLGARLIGSASRGSTRTMINLSIVKSVLVPLPPLAQQDEIARKTHEVKSRNSMAVQALLRQVAVLREGRQALITAAVTGQLDIREAA